MGALLSLFLLMSTARAEGSFDDQAFREAVKRTADGPSALIYTWSPHMVLSQRGLNEILSFPLKGSLRIIVLLDPQADLEVARAQAKANGWPAEYLRPVSSNILFGLGVRVHYPSYLLIENGQVRDGLIPGYKTHVQLRRILDQRK